jgi:hypothetical protein
MPDDYELRQESAPAPEVRSPSLIGFDDYALPGQTGYASRSTSPGGHDFASRPTHPRPCSRWRFYATVFLFPWRWEVIRHWLLLTGGLTPALALLAVSIQPTPHSNLGHYGRIALLFLGTPLIIVLMATVAYAAAVFISVVEATSAGADRIETWPDDEWVEWLGQLVHLGYAAAVALLLSYGAASLALSGLRSWIAPSVTLTIAVIYASFLIIFFPIVLLSTQHAVFGWLPITRSVLRSLAVRKTDAAWALFACACVPLGLLPLGQFIYAPAQYLVIAAAGMGPQIAAGLLIYARLLGRLGWEISEHLPDAPSEEDEEEEEIPVQDPPAWTSPHGEGI